MRLILIAICLLYFSFISYGQIMLESFENWEQVNNYLEPINWDTNSDSLMTRFTMDPMSVDGDYALKIGAGGFTGWDGCENLAWTEILLDTVIGKNKNFVFYAKSIPDLLNSGSNKGVFLKMRILMEFKAGVTDTIFWETEDPIKEYRRIEIPIRYPDLSKLYITIAGGAIAGAADGCVFKSYSWIDAIQIDTTRIITLADDTKSKPKIKVFPNPSEGQIKFEGDLGLYEKYQIMDINGRIIQEENLSKPALQMNKNGFFMIKFIPKDRSKSKVVRKIIIK